MWVLSVTVLGCWAAALMLIDVRHNRLPDPLTLPVAAAAVLTAGATDPGVLLAGLAWPALYLLVGLFVGGVGGGDLKLAVSLGVTVAAVAGPLAVLAACGTAGAMGVLAAVATSRRATAHGPPMFLAAALACGVGLWW